MGSVPAWARLYVACVVAGALVCLAPVPGVHVPWWAVGLLAALYAGCEHLTSGGSGGCPPRWHTPVLLAGAFLLPPAAAALVAVPGALLARVEQRPRGLRRVWRAARLGLAVWAASRVHGALAGRDAVAQPHFPDALVPVGAAVLVFCAVLTALDGGILALAERVPVRNAWRGLFPRSLAPAAVHGLAGLMMAVLWRSHYGPVAALLVLLPMYVSCWVFEQYHRERAAHQATIRALVQAVDIKDGYTRGHSERVGRASRMIACELGMDDARIEVLRFAGILHDVGKLGVPTRLLRKNGPLTPEERRVIELHPEYGHEMVRGIGFLGEARLAILHHHERLDGGGYPYGLTGDQIPECARVVAVADAFDAMTSTRCYRRARPVADALEELERCAGTQFDPEMVEALARALGRHGWHPAVTADGDDQRGNVPPQSAPLRAEAGS
ncbi:HD-GYP domain-containing protein [Streptomyces bluensis]|uniref:HD-GYP domain-containing protein n=1 Tax=Streptomyces bluensis TaxID=33897 RepID=UPI0010640C27|nr:HD-GYP domain-containing protein [Streptomyces bluensis]GGZ89774.1 metal-dependent phosphohydrolase [Streptomyces bluensis]